ncbi:MAG: 16S rRNA (guanine(966)-N(2))-methyltransferase RsmD [Bacteroidia bacterium]|nr:16S rRNA (guanine(966)-N(2))-methyltransferase RsmD [Bacteroidia bacterium]MDW8346687.1 16S rRNA (guanine(966)-N(2))-methyltransferase RsmD [Bacteroidia bacterium]
MIRIISGKFKGRKLYLPKHLCARPTMDMAKEGLFNILEHRFLWAEVTWLDLFAGTGNMTYEALSRGAKHATMVEKDKKCVQFIQNQIKNLNLDAQVTLIKQDVWNFIDKPATAAYAIIFLDPPYRLPNQDKLILQLFEYGFVLSGGLVILEHECGRSFESLCFFKGKRIYGSSAFSFFSYSDEYCL